MRKKYFVTICTIVLAVTAAVQGAAETVGTQSVSIPAGCIAAKGAKVTPCGHADRIIHEKTGIELVLIPAGHFSMGIKREVMPIHRVEIRSPFYIGTTEVTNKTYRSFISQSGYEGEGDTDPVYDLYLRHWRGQSLMSQADDHPIVWISWKNAKAFCGWAGLKLPTESQWEYACRAGTTTIYYFGDNEKDCGDHGWHLHNSQSLTHAVAQKRPNAWGLYDMSGNVWEWVEDDYIKGYEGAPVDGSARVEGKMTKVLRGGAWSNNTWAWVCGSGARLNSAPGNASNDAGFRVVLPVVLSPQGK